METLSLTRERVEVPPYRLALFDDAGDAGAAGDAGVGAAGAGGDAGAQGASGAQGGKAVPQATAPARDDRGRFSIPATDDPRELKRALQEANDKLGSAHSRIGELNEESKRHRLNHQSTKAELEAVKTKVDALPTLQQQVAAQSQRLIRVETRDALRAEGAVSDRVVDLFLADHKESVKIDDQTGEPTGIREHLAAWKAANAALFKAATGTTDGGKDGADGKDGKDGANASGGDGKDGKSGDANARPNSTAQGAGLAGGASSDNGTIAGLPDLRKLTPEQRRVALADYKRDQRLAGRR